MSEASLCLQVAALAWLRADARLQTLIAQRVYDEPPAQEARIYPDVTLGEGQTLPDDPGGEHSECYLVLHVWSRRNESFAECKLIEGALRRALHEAPLQLDGVALANPVRALAPHALIDLQYERSDYLIDPDGRTRHGVVTFVALIDPLS